MSINFRFGCNLQSKLSFSKNIKWFRRQQFVPLCTVAIDDKTVLNKDHVKRQQKPQHGYVQPFDYTALVANCSDIRNNWLPAKIEKILMCDQWTWALNLRTLDRQGWLYLCWHPQAYHICTSRSPPQRGESSELFDVVSKVDEHIKGLVLDVVDIPRPWERVCLLVLRVRPNQAANGSQNGNQLGEEPIKKLMYFEGQGKYSNVILANPDDRILVVAHQVGKGQSGARQLQVGGIYQLPPEQSERLAPDSKAQQNDWVSVLKERGTGKKVAETMVDTFAACSILQAKEVCRQGGIGADKMIEDVSESQWVQLYNAWKLRIGLLESQDFVPAFTPMEGNSYGVFTTRSSDQEKESQSSSLGDGVRDYYQLALLNEQYMLLRAQLLKQVRAAMKKTDGKIYALQQQIDQSEQMEATKKKADLLMANAYRYKEGMREIEVDDWETGEKVVIEFDEDSNLIETAEKLFKKTKKFKRAEENVGPLLETAKQNQTYLQSVEENIILINEYHGSEEDWIALKGIREELVEEGFMKPPSDYQLAKKATGKNQKQKNKGKGDSVRSQLREFKTPRGLTVLVGRNNIQNDELSLRIANKGDHWFHARGVPGAHVVLRVPAGQVAEEEDILFAADLAAYWSKAQSSGKVMVTTTDATNVKKVPGGKPGLVMVLREKVVVGNTDNVVNLGLNQL